MKISNNLKIILFSILIGSSACMIAVFAFSSPGSNQPPNGNPTFWLLNGTSMYYSGGSVGIGTNNPYGVLNLTGGNTLSSFTGTSTGMLKLQSPTTAVGQWIALDFQQYAGSLATARIAERITSGGSYLDFGTSNSWGSGITNQAMTIDMNGNVGIGATTPGASLEVKGTMKIFGAWSSYSPGTVYQAPTDGFVVAALFGNSAWGNIMGYTDSNNPPTTLRCAASQDYQRTGADRNSFTMPVRKGDYWLVNSSIGPNGSVSIYWMPLGT